MSVGRFLARVRARLVISAVLAGALFAVVLTEATRWSAAAAIVHLGWRVPVLNSLGLLFLVALAPLAARRWSRAAAAAQADSRLGLQDRLASYVDFSSRADVPPQLRRAQAAETAGVLAGIRPAAAVPIAGWRATAPLLFLLSLTYPFIIPFGTGSGSPLLQLVLSPRRLLPPTGLTPGDDPASSPEGTGSANGPVGVPPRGNEQKTHGRGGAAPQGKVNAAAEPTVNEAGKLPGGARDGAAQEGKPGAEARRSGRGPGNPQEPERIESERIGETLARVVAPLYTPGGGGGSPAVLPSGTFVFHLLPQSGAAGASGGSGREAREAEPVRIDLDAVPVRYRPVVKAYFDQLAAAAPAGGGRSARGVEGAGR